MFGRSPSPKQKESWLASRFKSASVDLPVLIGLELCSVIHRVQTGLPLYQTDWCDALPVNQATSRCQKLCRAGFGTTGKSTLMAGSNA